MKKNNKIIIGIVAVLVVSSLALASQSELFQGRFFFKKPAISQIDFSKLYSHKGRVVSAVASPMTSVVPSVVVSEVTSSAGTSRVASVVVSGVTSSVASAVAVDKSTASSIDTKELENLTEKTLRNAAQEDYKKNKKKYESATRTYYKNNPGKFTLSEKEKDKLIELYEKKNPEEFIFRPLSK